MQVHLNNVLEAIGKRGWKLRTWVTLKVSQKVHFYSAENRTVVEWGEHPREMGWG